MTEVKVAKKSAKKSPKKASEGAFAVIETGGKQYIVRKGDVLKIEKLEGESGEKVSFDKVLLHSEGDKTTIGTPYIAGKKVEGELIAQGRAKKILVVKFKQKSRYMKRNGHRQPFTEIEIKSI
ncbi:MAG: 50S ribosomal protein L21 [Minisyncoccia bacterium]